MAGFEGIHWASKQMRYVLEDRIFELVEPDSRVCAVSRSIHYGLFLAFEGIRFFCRRIPSDGGSEDAGGPSPPPGHTPCSSGSLELVFLNWHENLERFRRGISFNLGHSQQHLVPTLEELESIFVRRFFGSDVMRPFLEEMADLGAQGYLRPFTVDEDQSIGVTFPKRPSIRAVAARYDRYLGEPFSGVVIPDYVRAIGANGTGCLKLGVNYLMSIKAVDLAKSILPEAASALLLDDMPHLPPEGRNLTEWDTSCCLIALRDNTVIKIPESPLILPSVTIRGIVRILGRMGVDVVERHMSYGELIELVRKDEVVAICSVGTAGILNRCDRLLLVDREHRTIGIHSADREHPLYRKLGEARSEYWGIYTGEVAPPPGSNLFRYTI